jgi:hypothetical protein
VVGLLMAWPAIQMVLGHETAVLPDLWRGARSGRRLAPIIGRWRRGSPGWSG